MKLLLKLIATVGAMAIFGASTSAYAVTNDGTPDLTFGTGGVATAPGTQEGDGVRGIVVQPSGKIVAIGYWATPGYSHGWNYHAARFNADGSPDNSFGNAGIYDADIAGRHDVPRGYAVQSDGKILIGGDIENVDSANYRATITRITADGIPDTTFASNGVWIDNRGTRSNFLRMVALSNDKLLITGRDMDYGRAFTLRLNADGSIDSTFGDAGYVYFDDNGSEKLGVGVLPDGSGKVVVAGTNGSQAWIYRLKSDGSLDTSFGTSGQSTYALAGSEVSITSVLKAGTGYVVTGSLRNSATGKKNIVALKVNQNGTLNNLFGTAGVSLLAPSETVEISGLASAISSNGIIYISGVRDVSGTTTGMLAAIGPDGVALSEFGTNGFTFGQASFYESLAIQDDGQVLAGGQINGGFAVERFTGASLAMTTLANTGSPSLGMVGFALLVIALGSHLVITARRQRKL